MSFLDINSLLERYEKLFGDHRRTKEAVTRVISTELGVTLADEQISIKNGVVTVAAHPTVKNELFLHRLKILEMIKEHGIIEIK